MSQNNLDLTILNPGGNITALIKGIPASLLQRKLVNDAVMKRFPKVEQVGFYTFSPPRLQMAGGEFCGNATRCLAYLLLDDKLGEIKIRVSGVNMLLAARIDRNGNTWAQMPLPQAAIRKAGDCLHRAPKRDYSSYNLSAAVN